MKKPVVAIDFDGTIHDGLSPLFRSPMPGARQFLQALRAEGYSICIHSCRNSPRLYISKEKLQEHLLQMEDWLIKNNMPFDTIDDGSQGKIIAEYYIDDRALQFDNNFDELLKLISTPGQA